MKLTVMTLQWKTYARHQYVTPQGHRAHGNRIVSEVVVVRLWVSGEGRGCVVIIIIILPPGTIPWRQMGGVRNKGIRGSKGGGAGQCSS